MLKPRIKLLFFALCLIATFLFTSASNTAAAEENISATVQRLKKTMPPVEWPKMVEIGGYDYYRSDVIRDFIMMAISETPWLSTSEEYQDFFTGLVADYDRITSAEKLPSHEIWAQEYIFHPNGFPREGVINKWEGEISIALGWPAKLLSYPPEFYKKVPWIEKYIETLIPDIKEVTGLPARYVSSDDPTKVARIRIIPMSGGIRKQLRIPPPQPHGWFLGNYDNDFWGGVQFTPNSQEQIEGYLLPKLDNSIGMAICHIGIDTSEDVIKSQISECLARSLGFPDISTQKYHDVILSNWGTPVKQGKPPKIVGGFAPYDKFMLKLLYCPEIKKQMDKYEVIKTLLKGTCIKTKPDKK